MDKKKHSTKKRVFFWLVNGFLILAILVVSVSLVSNYITMSYSRSVEGTWTGIITDDYGEFIVYDYTVTIVKGDEEGRISGKTFAQSQPDFPDVHAGSLFFGTIEDNTVTFKDVSIYKNNTDWCHIRATLEWTNHNGVETLMGKWEGLYLTCSGLSGRIHLTRASD